MIDPQKIKDIVFQLTLDLESDYITRQHVGSDYQSRARLREAIYAAIGKLNALVREEASHAST